MTACTPGRDGPPNRPVATLGPTPSVIVPPTPSATVVREVEPWIFGDAEGQLVKTDHFAIYTTEKSALIAERLPGFLETALRTYTTTLGELPLPDGRMESFVMATRPQWKNLTIHMLGTKGRDLLNIQAGGFAYGGRAFLFDVGSANTMSLAAHEGWHQYTQRTFAESLPVWLEEGIATYMEGHRWNGNQVIFLPWANTERFDYLREVSGRGELLSLETLLTTVPANLLTQPQEAAVTYYAQVWALVHFLHEGADGKYRPALSRLVKDAATGRLSQAVASQLRSASRPNMLAMTAGLPVFHAYFDSDISKVGAEYRVFMERLVSPGSRQNIVAGKSPMSP